MSSLLLAEGAYVVLYLFKADGNYQELSEEGTRILPINLISKGNQGTDTKHDVHRR